jgi:RimJ/RimL family protein N-acetyltransferase
MEEFKVPSNMHILIAGERVALRDRHISDVDRFVAWQTRGEWRRYDAPWEGFGDTLTREQEEKIRSHFTKLVSSELPEPRVNAMIVLRDENRLIGWVNRYGTERFPDVYYVGINICEDACLNQGLGTEALRLWVSYLFTGSTVHKIECHTWSLNPRMVRVAEKLGFREEGRERELIQWQGEWQDRIRFGMLRQEWGDHF